MRKALTISFALLIIIVTLSSCGGARKCSGNRGIKTPMGTM